MKDPVDFYLQQLELAGLPAPRAIGIDVIHVGKGKKFRIIVSDLDLKHPVWVGGVGRREADLDQFFDWLGALRCAGIEVVVMDTWKSFQNSRLKNAPQARVIYDRFHIMGHLSKALDEVCRDEYKRLNGDKAGGKNNYARGQLYTLLSKRENLRLDGSQALKKRLDANRRVHTAQVLRETFAQLWDYDNEPDARVFFERWKEGLKRRRLKPFLKFSELVESHWEGIGSHVYAESGISLDLVEEINNQLRLLQPAENDAGEEEHFERELIAAFLPPVPATPCAEPPLPEEISNDAEQSWLQPWFNLLCQMLPNVSRGVVLQVEQGACLPVSICWPVGEAPAEDLTSVAIDVVAQATPTVQGRIFAHPLRLDDHLFGVAVIELTVSQGQQAVVQQLMNWSEQWLRLLLGASPSPSPNSKPNPNQKEQQSAASNSLPNIMPVLEQVLQAQPLQAAVLAATNCLAEQFACERVVLGLVQGKRIRVRGLSHGTEFDGKSRLIQELEAAMEATRAAADIALWPPGQAGNTSTAAVLEPLSESNGRRTLCAFPLFGRQEVIGVVLCERAQHEEFSAAEQEAFLAAGRLLGPVFELKQEQSKTLLRRRALERRLDQLIRPGHRRFKAAVAVVLMAVAVLIVGQGKHQVSSSASIEGLIQSAVVAPFDGYIAAADVRAGDTVVAGDIMARLDDRELSLELKKSTSEEEKLNNEYRKALAGLDRSEGRIVQARLEQVQAQSKLLQQKLARIQLTAPLDGIILSGDLSRSLGAPVERGQVLFEVAPLDEYRLVLDVHEQEIANIAVGQFGSLTLTALPHERWRFVVEQVSPVFQEVDGQVSYRTEASIEGSIQGLRPGMEGVGKIEVGRRSLGWILFHKAWDWMHLHLWLWLP